MYVELLYRNEINDLVLHTTFHNSLIEIEPKIEKYFFGLFELKIPQFKNKEKREDFLKRIIAESREIKKKEGHSKMFLREWWPDTRPECLWRMNI